MSKKTLIKTDEQKKALRKITILCWAAFIAILGCMWPAGPGLDNALWDLRTSELVNAPWPGR